MDSFSERATALGYAGYAVVDLDKLCQNYENIKSHIGRNVDIIPVVKGNCYGYGMDEICHTLWKRCGVNTIAIADVCEGVRLRRIGYTDNIMVIGGAPPEVYRTAIENNMILPVYDTGCARDINRIAAQLGITAAVQIKIETGMNRMGVRPGENLKQLIRTLKQLDNVRVVGTYTHFAKATEKHDELFTKIQHQRFTAALSQVKNAGFPLEYVHCCNSAAAIWFDEAYHSHVRVGGILYGNHVMEDGVEPVELEEILSLHTFVTNVHTLPAGESLGYSQRFHSEKDLKVATIAMGFADGILPGYARGQGPVLVNGVRTRFLEICMDQAIIDVTEVPCQIGDKVTIIGKDGDAAITLKEIEEFTGVTFEYLITFLSDRILRVYSSNDQSMLQID